MSNNIIVSNSLNISELNTPLDVRSRVATLEDVEAIENPFVGMIFYCLADSKHYKVETLKSKQIGALTVENAQVDVYSVLSAEADLSNVYTKAETDTKLVKKTEVVELAEELEDYSAYPDGTIIVFPNIDGTEITGSSDIAIGENGNWYIDGVDTGNPSNGAKGEQGIQGVQGLQGPKGDKGDKGEMGSNGLNGADGIIQVVVSATAPPNPVNGMIWIKP